MAQPNRNGSMYILRKEIIKEILYEEDKQIARHFVQNNNNNK